MSSTSPVSPAVQIECVEGIPIVVIFGRLDTNSAPLFDTHTASLHEQPCPRVLLDFSSLTYISSAGLRSIIKLIKHAAASGGRAGVFAVAEPIMELIEISGFQPLLDIYADRESALQGGRK